MFFKASWCLLLLPSPRHGRVEVHHGSFHERQAPIEGFFCFRNCQFIGCKTTVLNGSALCLIWPQATRTPLPIATASVSRSPFATVSNTPSPTTSLTPSGSRSHSPSPTASRSGTPSPSRSPTVSFQGMATSPAWGGRDGGIGRNRLPIILIRSQCQ
jgi:hypothetical protein